MRERKSAVSCSCHYTGKTDLNRCAPGSADERAVIFLHVEVKRSFLESQSPVIISCMGDMHLCMYIHTYVHTYAISFPKPRILSSPSLSVCVRIKASAQLMPSLSLYRAQQNLSVVTHPPGIFQQNLSDPMMTETDNCTSLSE